MQDIQLTYFPHQKQKKSPKKAPHANSELSPLYHTLKRKPFSKTEGLHMEIQATPYLEEEVFQVLFDSVMPEGPPSDTVLDLTCVDGIWQYVE